MAFIKWLPTKIKEFQNKSPEEITEALNILSKTEEGQIQLRALVEEFKQSSETSLFKKGGKLNYLIEKFQKGNKYNRQQARKNKEAAGLYNFDEETGQKYRKIIDKGNLKAKIAKSKAVDGYEDEDFIDSFDRKNFRQKKRALKKANPNMTRRERKAEALLSRPKILPTIDPEKLQKFDSGISYTFPKKGIVSVGDLTEEVIPNPVPTTKNINVYPPIITMPTVPARSKLNWNEFAHAIETRLRNDGTFRAGMDMSALQALMEDEYKRYYENPDSYKFDNYQLQESRFNKYRNRSLTMPQPIYRAGYGDFDQDTSYLFNNERMRTIPSSNSYKAMTKGISYPIMATIAATAALPSAVTGVKEIAGVAREAGKQAIQRGRESDLYPHLRRQFGDRYNLATTQGGGKYGNAPYYLPEGTLSNYWFFKNGGTLVNKLEKGGKQRQSDKSIKEFHGVDLFKYGPNSRQRINNTFDGTPIPSGSNSKTLPNGVGMRQISRRNITTTELVSPDKRDTLYIHNGIGGRVDSNIDDSGILGFFGLKKSSPVSDRYKFLQEIFKSHKF